MVNNDEDSAVKIKEYLRFRTEIKVYEVDLEDRSLYMRTDLMNTKFIYTHIFQLPPQTCQSLLNHSRLSESLKQWFGTIHFWMKWNDNNNMAFKDLFKVKNENCKRAFIVSLIKSSIVDVCYKKFGSMINKSTVGSACSSQLRTIDNTCEDVFLKNESYLLDEDFTSRLSEYILSDVANNEYIKEIKTKLAAFTPPLAINHSQVKRTNAYKLGSMFNLRLIHCLCEYQAIYLSLGYVQGVLNAFEPGLKSTIKLLDLSCYFNGTFLHNFIGELERRPSPDLYIEEFFGRKSLLKYVYMKLMMEFDSCFRCDETTEQMDL